MSSKPETLCTGCGATVTIGMGLYPTGNDTWRDASYSPYCADSLAAASPVLHYVVFPPVAIQPEAEETFFAKLESLRHEVRMSWGVSVCDDGERALDLLETLIELLIAKEGVK